MIGTSPPGKQTFSPAAGSVDLSPGGRGEGGEHRFAAGSRPWPPVSLSRFLAHWGRPHADLIGSHGAHPPRFVMTPPDQLDSLLTDYERRKQDETRRMVQRAFKLENARKKGAEHLRRFALPHLRDVADRLQEAGHAVVYQEFLDAYPPNVRLHLYPKTAPMDLEESKRRSLELVWGDPEPDRLFVRRWTSQELGEVQDQVSAPAIDVDELWVREQLLAFVREALDLA